MAAYKIRSATPADVLAIFELITALSEYEKLAHEMVGTPEDLHQGLFAKKPVAEAIVAEVDGKTVGFALFFYNFSTFLMKPGIYLEDLFVSPDYRRQGIATGLLNYLANHAVEQGCGRLEWSVLDWNEDAITFYKKIGALLMDEWTGCRVTGKALVNLAKPAK
ncbi:GNAT family N-acetyltransferase [cf. Phormidesmis sp. LEGE 11477]|uniref:GNAT family N-acetyltransferase n=1 Tax=cf. Phormidesmis sp. LEGE 11477 TaxID=1828680 RepID=UPI0018817F26|nr:GNAT family N-acetyltransferase [cf. Phormidesmis sp. LEGE 11477]MBE9064755.1 GNAT family N-acetyltransferase [cf. Phormidesmis sp. LEGE 11477]